MNVLEMIKGPLLTVQDNPDVSKNILCFNLSGYVREEVV